MKQQRCTDGCVSVPTRSVRADAARSLIMARACVVVLAACLLPTSVLAQETPGGVSSGLSVWYDAGVGIPQGTPT